MDKVEKALHTRSDNFTALLEKKRKEVIQEHGSEWLNTLKKEHHNSAIEELVLNSTSTQFYKEAHNRIYLKSGRFIWNRTIIGDVRLSIVMRKNSPVIHFLLLHLIY